MGFSSRSGTSLSLVLCCGSRARDFPLAERRFVLLLSILFETPFTSILGLSKIVQWRVSLVYVVLFLNFNSQLSIRRFLFPHSIRRPLRRGIIGSFVMVGTCAMAAILTAAAPFSHMT